ncbi:MAG: frataxin family protein [Alphaproteobacteria bacterium]
MNTQSRVFFQRLNEVLDDQCGAICDIDGDDRHIELSLPSGQVFLLNFHGPTQQIWLSSPISGAHHYVFVDEQWCSTRNQEPILDRLSAELTQTLGQSVMLT